MPLKSLRTPGRGVAIAACAVALATMAFAHVDDPKERDLEPPYEGPGYRADRDGEIDLGFPASGVQLMSWITLMEFPGGHSSGNDCWGYVSPSGREYALMGLQRGTGIVEVTNPGSPVILGVITGPTSTWRDIKVYDEYAYAVSEDGNGIQVMDLRDVDNGNVSLVREVTTGGVATHNVAIDTTSGYLYRTGGSGNGLLIYDINTDPSNPVLVGQWPNRYVHDAQVHTFTSGPFMGRQIAFLCSGDGNGGTNTGVETLDVTNKGNIVELDRVIYSGGEYSHQAWLTEDQNFLILNDELDEPGLPSTGIVFDVSDVNNIIQETSFTNGNTAITHNLYVRGDFIYAANYTSGLRVFDASDPLNPVETAYFDTYPQGDGASFNGLWSTYPFFPSGTVLGSDTSRGLFVLRVQEPMVAISVPSLPQFIEPTGDTLDVEITELQPGGLVPGSETLHHSVNGGPFQTSPLSNVSGSLYRGTFPAFACGDAISFYVSVEDSAGGIVTSPAGAPGTVYTAFAALGEDVLFVDNFEANQGWATENLGAVSGDWQRGVPVNDPSWQYDPTSDGDGSGQCFLTQNQLGNTDVDDGAVRLTSPSLDLSESGVTVSYLYYLYLTDENGTDRMLVEASSSGGPWREVTRHDTSGSTSWREHTITEADLLAANVTPTADVRLRFTVNDGDPQSIVESGLDGFEVNVLLCGAACPPDVNGDTVVDVLDLLAVLTAWGPCPGCAEDVNGDGAVDVLDLLEVLSNWGPCP